jgi:hypothetical protein
VIWGFTAFLHDLNAIIGYLFTVLGQRQPPATWRASFGRLSARTGSICACRSLVLRWTDAWARLDSFVVRFSAGEVKAC